MIVPDGTDDSIVCRYRSPAGNCYWLSINDGKGHVPVALIDRSSFDNWKEHLEARTNWGICEIIDNPWGPWELQGSIPTEVGTHTYTEVRTCSTGGNANACPDTCIEATQERQQTITNEPPPCVESSWDPSPYSFWEGQSFVQTSNCGTTRNAVGISPLPTSNPEEPTPKPTPTPTPTPTPEPVCDKYNWQPPLPGHPSEFYEDQYIDQTNGCNDVLRTYGTKKREPVCTNSGWTPSASTVPLGQLFTQYDSSGLSHCTRPETGTKAPDNPPLPSCTPVQGYYEAALYFKYIHGAEDFAEYAYGSSMDDLINNANAIINSYTSSGAFEFLYYSDNSMPGVTCP